MQVEIDKKDLLICKICGKVSKGITGTSNHINRKHKISPKEYFNIYYVKHLKCEYKFCDKEASFKNLSEGYRRFCSKQCSNKNSNPDDILGQKFGKLTPVKFEYRGSNLWYTCKCDCGKEKSVSSHHLRSENTSSCGCLLLEIGRDRAFKDDKSGVNRSIAVYKKNAKLRGLAFRLTPSEAENLMRGDCHYCGAKPSNIFKTMSKYGQDFIYNGIDRKDNTKEYCLENCVSCCARCNYTKSSMHIDDFMNMVIDIYNHSIIRKESQPIAEQIEKLATATIKLYFVCDKKADAAKNPDKYSQEELEEIARQDIELCKQRAQLKGSIDKYINAHLGVLEVKKYGN